jgi:hypothetical protein
MSGCGDKLRISRYVHLDEIRVASVQAIHQRYNRVTWTAIGGVEEVDAV